MILCPHSHLTSISHYLTADAPFTNLKIDIQPYENVRQRDGPCAVLHQFAQKITVSDSFAGRTCSFSQTDFILMSCDFIPAADMYLSTLLDAFRMDPDGLLLAALFHDQAPAPPFAGDEVDTPPTIIYDAQDNTLLAIDDDDEDEVDVSMGMLWQRPRVTLATNLNDAHVYACRRSVLDALPAHRFHSIRSDFVPWLLGVQTHTKRRNTWGPGMLSSHDILMTHASSSGWSL